MVSTPRKTAYPDTSTVISLTGEMGNSTKAIVDVLEVFLKSPSTHPISKDLRRVVDTARLLSLRALILFGEQLLELTRRMEAGSIAPAGPPSESLRSGLVALQRYLTNAAQGKIGSGLVLFAAYNDLGRHFESSHAQYNRAELFLPVSPVYGTNSLTYNEGKFIAEVARYQDEFRQAKLRFEQGRSIETINSMRTALVTMETKNPPANFRMLLSLSISFFDIVIRAGGQMSSADEPLLASIDTELAGVVKGDFDLDEALISWLMYVIGQAPQFSARIRSFQELYDLPRMIEEDAGGLVSAQTIEAAHKALALAQRSWEVGLTKGGDLKATKVDAFALAAICNTIGDYALKTMAMSMGLLANEVIAGAVAVNQDTAVFGASIMIAMGDRLERLVQDPKGGRAIADFHRERVRLVTSGTKASDLNGQSPSQAEHMRPILDEVLNNVSAAEQIVDQLLREGIKEQKLEESKRLLSMAVSALSFMNLERGAEFAQKVAGNIDAILVKLLSGEEPNQAVTMRMAESVMYLGRYLKLVTVDSYQADTTLAIGLGLFNEQAPLDEPAEDDQPDGPQDICTDDELGPIFFEEAADVIKNNITPGLAQLRLQPSNENVIQDVRRGFHTLKGSARMVDLSNLGALGQAAEYALNVVRDNQGVSINKDMLDWLDSITSTFAAALLSIQKTGRASVDPRPFEAVYARFEESRRFTLDDVVGTSGAFAHREAPEAVSDDEPAVHIADTLPTIVAAQEPEAASEFELLRVPAPISLERSPAEAVVAQPLSIELDAPPARPEEAAQPPLVDREIALDTLPALEPAEPNESSVIAVEMVGQTIQNTESASMDEDLGIPPSSVSQSAETQSDIIVGEVGIPTALFNAFVLESRSLYAQLEAVLLDLLSGKSKTVDFEAMRLAHTLAGMGRATGLKAITELASELEAWATINRDHPPTMSEDLESVLRDALEAMETMLLGIEDKIEPESDLPLLMRLRQIIATDEHDLAHGRTQDAVADSVLKRLEDGGDVTDSGVGQGHPATNEVSEADGGGGGDSIMPTLPPMALESGPAELSLEPTEALIAQEDLPELISMEDLDAAIATADTPDSSIPVSTNTPADVPPTLALELPEGPIEILALPDEEAALTGDLTAQASDEATAAAQAADLPHLIADTVPNALDFEDQANVTEIHADAEVSSTQEVPTSSKGASPVVHVIGDTVPTLLVNEAELEAMLLGLRGEEPIAPAHNLDPVDPFLPGVDHTSQKEDPRSLESGAGEPDFVIESQHTIDESAILVAPPILKAPVTPVSTPVEPRDTAEHDQGHVPPTVHTESSAASPIGFLGTAAAARTDVITSEMTWLEIVRSKADDVDEEMIDIFLEEAQERFTEIDSALSAMASDISDRKLMVSLKRGIHTLKGSANTAGARKVGALFHLMEDLLNEAPMMTQELYDRTQSGVDAAFAGIAAMRGQGSVEEAVERSTRGAAREDLAASDAQAALVEEANTSKPGTETEGLASNIDPMESTPSIIAGVEGGERSQSALGQRTGNSRQAREDDSTTLKVSVKALDRMVKTVGEANIARTRVSQAISLSKQSINGMGVSLQMLYNLVRQVELQAEKQMAAGAQGVGRDTQFDALQMDRFTRLQELTRRLAEAHNDVQTQQAATLGASRDMEEAVATQYVLMSDLSADLDQIRQVRVSSIVPNLKRVVRAACRDTGKKGEIHFDADAQIDRGILDKIAAPLEHILRNAVAHGIEAPRDRAGAGKDETGSIEFRAYQNGSEVVIEIRDDGRGIDAHKVLYKAVERGLVRPGTRLTEDKVRELLFEPGFSTAEAVSDIAGRGVGLDVVRTEIAAMGGRVEIQSTLGTGTTFILRLPATLTVIAGASVVTNNHMYIIPVSFIDRLVRIGAKDLESAYRTQKLLVRDAAGETVEYDFWGLWQAVNSPSMETRPTNRNSIILMRGDRVAMHVDDIRPAQEFVFRPMGPQLSSSSGVIGSTINAAGNAALVIDPGRIVRTLRKAAVSQGKTADVRSQMKQDKLAPLVLIVDDSLTVRKVTTRLLKKEGFRHAEAENGLRCLEKIQDERPDIILMDIEMPVMNGFEAVQAIRSEAKTRDIPIIMITSRAGESHRSKAFQLGVNAYLGKPYNDVDLMSAIRTQLASLKETVSA